MRLIDRLIYKEIVGPWLFGVGLFTALIMAGTYLGRLAEYIQESVPVGMVLELTGLYMPAILVKTFSMAVLLAALLAFGRLSSDSEIVALRAGGASVARIVRPVMVFSVLIAVVTFLFNERVVPGVTVRSAELMDEIAHTLHPKMPMPRAVPIVEDYKLYGFVCAKNVSPATGTLEGVTVIAVDDDGNDSFTLKADEIRNLNAKRPTDWEIHGHATVIPADLGGIIDVSNGIWPTKIPMPNKTVKEIAEAGQGPPNFDKYSLTELRQRIEQMKRLKNESKGEIVNFEYGFWNKFAVPLAALVFGTLGAVLGIRGHRTGTSTGFALSIAIIFGYVTLANFMNVWAMGGVIPAYVASFAPLTIGMIVALFIMWKRNG